MKSRYTFRLGEKQPTGLEFLFRVDGETAGDAIRTGDRLLDARRKGFLGGLRRRWDQIHDKGMLSEDNLVDVCVLPGRRPEQLRLPLAAYDPEPVPYEAQLFVPVFTGYVEEFPRAA